MVEELVAQMSDSWTPIDIPANVYLAEVIKIRDLVFEDRNTWAISFKIAEGQHKDTIVEGLCSARLTEKSKLWQWAKAMGIQILIGSTVKKTDLVGKHCRVLTAQKTLNNGKVNAYVKEVLTA